MVAFTSKAGALAGTPVSVTSMLYFFAGAAFATWFWYGKLISVAATTMSADIANSFLVVRSSFIALNAFLIYLLIAPHFFVLNS